MEEESSFSAVAPPVFDGDNYQIEMHGEFAADRSVDSSYGDLSGGFGSLGREDYEVPPLPTNPIVAQIKA